MSLKSIDRVVSPFLLRNTREPVLARDIPCAEAELLKLPIENTSLLVDTSIKITQNAINNLT